MLKCELQGLYHIAFCVSDLAQQAMSRDSLA